MLPFENSVIINQPIETVFCFTTNIENNPKWQSGLLESGLTSPGAMGVGATYRCVNKFMGVHIETEGVITEYAPYRECTYQITSGPVKGASSFIFEPVDGGTRVTTAGEADLSFFKLTKSLAIRKVRKQLRNDMKTLRKVIEAGF